MDAAHWIRRDLRLALSMEAKPIESAGLPSAVSTNQPI